ncbi:hypothetical protein V1514DRAFT_331975 [Lipomyces japonicus]|uniref:uncharacterized protein n=1 Tax=Lipomyces japonicus TaxID=56871 RepID=UPI0034CE06AE
MSNFDEGEYLRLQVYVLQLVVQNDSITGLIKRRREQARKRRRESMTVTKLSSLTRLSGSNGLNNGISSDNYENHVDENDDDDDGYENNDDLIKTGGGVIVEGNVLKKFIHLTVPGTTIQDLQYEIAERYFKLYKTHVEVASLKDQFDCDLDPEYVSSAVFKNDSIVYVLSSEYVNALNQASSAIEHQATGHVDTSRHEFSPSLSVSGPKLSSSPRSSVSRTNKLSKDDLLNRQSSQSYLTPSPSQARNWTGKRWRHDLFNNDSNLDGQHEHEPKLNVQLNPRLSLPPVISSEPEFINVDPEKQPSSPALSSPAWPLFDIPIQQKETVATNPASVENNADEVIPTQADPVHDEDGLASEQIITVGTGNQVFNGGPGQPAVTKTAESLTTSSSEPRMHTRSSYKSKSSFFDYEIRESQVRDGKLLSIDDILNANNDDHDNVNRDYQDEHGKYDDRQDVRPIMPPVAVAPSLLTTTATSASNESRNSAALESTNPVLTPDTLASKSLSVPALEFLTAAPPALISKPKVPTSGNKKRKSNATNNAVNRRTNKSRLVAPTAAAGAVSNPVVARKANTKKPAVSATTTNTTTSARTVTNKNNNNNNDNINKNKNKTNKVNNNNRPTKLSNALSKPVSASQSIKPTAAVSKPKRALETNHGDQSSIPLVTATPVTPAAPSFADLVLRAMLRDA